MTKAFLRFQYKMWDYTIIEWIQILKSQLYLNVSNKMLVIKSYFKINMRAIINIWPDTIIMYYLFMRQCGDNSIQL